MIKYIDEKSTYIDNTVKIGDNCIIYPNVIIEGNSVIGDNSIIYAGSYIKDSIIGKDNRIFTSYILDSKIGDNNEIGPYTHIRANNTIGDNNKLGSFVEFKNNIIGNGNKIPHLSYVGDAEIGNNVEIGCGVVTVNWPIGYPMDKKEKTIIHDNSFIGCNSNLLAPLTLGRNSVVGAGSTITEDVPDNALAIARERQTIKENYR